MEGEESPEKDAPLNDAEALENEWRRRQTQERHDADMRSARQAHFFRRVALAAILSCGWIPAYLLWRLGRSVFSNNLWVFVFIKEGMGSWAVGVFIAGVFASFIAVFGFLAKGAFSHSRRQDGNEGESFDVRVGVARVIDALVRLLSRKGS